MDEAKIVLEQLIFPLFGIPSVPTIPQRTLAVILQKATFLLQKEKRDEKDYQGLFAYLDHAKTLNYRSSPQVNLENTATLLNFYSTVALSTNTMPALSSKVQATLIIRAITLYTEWTSPPFAAANAALFSASCDALASQFGVLSDVCRFSFFSPHQILSSRLRTSNPTLRPARLSKDSFGCQCTRANSMGVLVGSNIQYCDTHRERRCIRPLDRFSTNFAAQWQKNSTLKTSIPQLRKLYHSASKSHPTLAPEVLAQLQVSSYLY